MLKTKKYFLIPILLTLLIFPACQTNFNSIPNEEKEVILNNPYQTHINLDQNQISDNPKLSTGLFEALIDNFPHQEEIGSFIDNNQEILSPSYHFISTTKPDHKVDYTLAIITRQNLSSTIDHLPAPSDYYLKYEHPFLYLSTSLNPTKVSDESINSFLTIYSISTESLKKNNDPDNIEKLNDIITSNFLENISKHLPIHLYYRDNNIVINSPVDLTNSNSNLNYIFNANNIDHISINQNLCQLLMDNYLDCDIIEFDSSWLTAIDINQNHYTISIKYPEPDTSQNIFNKIKTTLGWQKDYEIKEKTLPDNTLTYQNLAGPTNIDTAIFENKIEYNNIDGNKININLSDQILTISNQSALVEPNFNSIIIPWTSLSQKIPSLTKINNITNISTDYHEDQIRGIIK